jgi:hypothetical protein
MRTLALLFCVVLVPGCDGGSQGIGIAGASWDSKDTLAELEMFQPYISPRIAEVVVENECRACTSEGCSSKTWAGISQHFEDIFRSFAFHVYRLEGTPISIPTLGLEASFVNKQFELTRNGEVITRESLPTAFGMHPTRLGVDKLGGAPIIMIVNKSRATTGRYFVAIYDSDGAALYRNVLIAWQVWDIEWKARSINILGCSETRTITMKASDA